MITLRRSADRYHERRRGLVVRATFDPGAGSGFEPVVALDEVLISPAASVLSLPFEDAEIITYVVEGALAGSGSPEDSAVAYAGEFERRSAGRGHRRTNASRSAAARVLRIVLRAPEGGLEPGLETKRFSIAQRRGVLCVIASNSGRSGSLRLRAQAQVYSAILESGRHLVYELAPDRRAWLHIVSGQVRTGGVILSSGDGAGITSEYAVSLIACRDSEILLVGLAGRSPRFPSNGAGP